MIYLIDYLYFNNMIHDMIDVISHDHKYLDESFLISYIKEINRDVWFYNSRLKPNQTEDQLARTQRYLYTFSVL